MKIFLPLFTSVYLLCTISPALALAAPEEISPYQVALEYAKDHNILEPMSDGLMHAEMPISRQDLVVSVVRDVYKNDIRTDCFDRIAPDVPARFTRLFTDVSVSNSSAKEICVGMFVGLLEGQRDGSFGAQASANLVDAAKVVTKAYGIAPLPSLRPQSRVAWHEPYWYALAKRGAIPETVKNRSSVLTRGEFAEILYRLRDERPAQGFHYQSVFVKKMAQTPASVGIADSFLNPVVIVHNSVIVSLPQNLSSGLQLQMHTEERRTMRLDRLEKEKRSTLDKYGLHPSRGTVRL